MIPETGFRWKVVGRKREMAAVGPKPGSTPTNVPVTHPIKQNKRSIGWRATLHPVNTFSIKPISNTEVSSAPVSDLRPPRGGVGGPALGCERHIPAGLAKRAGEGTGP